MISVGCIVTPTSNSLADRIEAAVRSAQDIRLSIAIPDAIHHGGLYMLGSPRVLILDERIAEPGRLGRWISWARDALPRAELVVLSQEPHAAWIKDRYGRGVLGFLSDRAVEASLVAALRRVANRELFLDSPTLETLLTLLKDEDGSVGDTRLHDAFATLTRREQEIFIALAAGDTPEQISRQFSITVKTVQSHRTQVFRKLGLSTVTDLFSAAVMLGVIDS